jgi:anti-sigma factor RsiW
MACDDCRLLLGGYVLDALEPDEMEAVRVHLTTCPGCAREHAELGALPAMLEAAGPTADVSPAKPPPSLEDAVLASFARDRRPAKPRPLRSWLARPLPVAAAAAAAAVVVTLVVSAGLDSSSDPGDRTYSARLSGSPAAPAARAYAKLDSFSSGTSVHLYVKGVRPEAGAVYELWCIGDDGRKTSAGTFRVDGAGRADVRLTTAARLGEYERLSVERSSAAGSRQRVMAGSIEY